MPNIRWASGIFYQIVLECVKRMFRKPLFLAICYLFFTFGYIFSVGFYHVGELAILIIISLLLFIFYLRPAILEKIQIPDTSASFKFILTLILIINVSIVGAKLGDNSQTNWGFFSLANRTFAIIAFVGSLTFLLKNFSAKYKRYRFLLLIILAFLIRIFSIISAPNPTIDVFYILRDGPKQLLLGTNPYELNYPSPYGVYIPKIIYVYGPLTSFIFLPSVVIFNDPRYTLIAADLISLFLLLKISRKLKIPSDFANLYALIFFYHPFFPFMTEQAWLEPVITTFTFLATYTFLEKTKGFWSGLFLGAILAIKSVYILPLFVFLKNSKSKVANYIAALVVLAVFTIPFLIANAPLFLERTQTYVTNPNAIGTYLAPTNVSLNISALLLKYTGMVLPTLVVVLIGLCISVLVIFFRRQGLAYATLSLFLVFITLFMFGPFVFINYFAFLGNLLILAGLLFLAKD